MLRGASNYRERTIPKYDGWGSEKSESESDGWEHKECETENEDVYGIVELQKLQPETEKMQSEYEPIVF